MDPILNETSNTEIQTETGTGLNMEADTGTELNVETESGTEPNIGIETGTALKTEPKRRTRRKKNGINIPSFLHLPRKDVRWYYDIRLWSPLILLILFLTALPEKQAVNLPVETMPEVTVVETVPVMETTPTEEPVIQEAAALARLADTVGAGRSDNVKTVIMWVAINRSEDRANGYGQALLTEIARPNQWQGYDENALYTDETYAIAKEVLEIQANGSLRPVDSDMLWFILNDDGSITLRNQFTATANQKWWEKTVK